MSYNQQECAKNQTNKLKQQNNNKMTYGDGNFT